MNEVVSVTLVIQMNVCPWELQTSCEI